MTNAVSFSALLRRYRLEAGLTQEALAERAFVSSKSIGALERDQSRLPRLETVRVLADALDLDEPRRKAFLSAARPAHSLSAPPILPSHNLSIPTTPLYGRERDLQHVCRLLTEAVDDGGSRLVVLTGPGGVGKTRLAAAAVQRCTTSLPITSVVIDLIPVTDSNLVFEGIARQLGMADRDQTPARMRIVALLRQNPTLVLLDNAEHLLDIRSDLLSLLDDCPDLVLLVTSRIPLDVRSEQRVRIEPLAIPALHSLASELVQSPAVQMFIDRARAAGWVSDSTHDLPTIAEICRRLDGLPLAIELAAAWMNLLSPMEVLRRLDLRIPLLTRGHRDMPERQQTMRAAIAWSYDLLDPNLQACFRRVCILENGATLTLICASIGGESSTVEIERQLAELTDQSLIGWKPHPSSRDLESELRILETIREFGRELLHESGEYDDSARNHAGVMLALTQQLENHLGGPKEVSALRRFDQSYDNVRAALTYSISAGVRDRCLLFAAALWRFWALRGALAEGAASMGAVISSVDDPSHVTPGVWLQVLTGAAMLAMDRGDLEAAAGYIDRSFDTTNSNSGVGGHAGVHYAAGLLAAQRGDNDRAETMFQEALEQARMDSDMRTVAGVLGEAAGLAARTGNQTRAAMLEQERLELCRQLGDRRGVALSTKSLALFAMYAGRFDDARRLGSESADELRAIGDTGILAEVLWALGHLAYLQGEFAAAAELLEESRSIRLARGDELNASKSSGVLAIVEIAQGNNEEALALVEAADGPLRNQQDRFGLAMNSIVWGHVEAARGNRHTAVALLNEGGELLLDIEHLHYLPWYFEGRAVLAAQDEEWALAAKLLGAHIELMIQVESAIPPVRPAALGDAEAATTAALGAAMYEQLHREGRADPIGLVSRRS